MHKDYKIQDYLAEQETQPQSINSSLFFEPIDSNSRVLDRSTSLVGRVQGGVGADLLDGSLYLKDHFEGNISPIYHKDPANHSNSIFKGSESENLRL